MDNKANEKEDQKWQKEIFAIEFTGDQWADIFAAVLTIGTHFLERGDVKRGRKLTEISYKIEDLIIPGQEEV